MQQRYLRIRKSQQGFGIMSVILGIVASAVLVLFAFKTYQYTMQKIKVNQAQDLIQKISTGVDSLYANFHDFSNITTKTVIDSGIVDSSDVVGSSIASPWYSNNKSSIVSVKPAGSPTSYQVSLANIPQKACSAVVSMFLQKHGSNITVNGTAVSDPATLATACASAREADIAINF